MSLMIPSHLESFEILKETIYVLNDISKPYNLNNIKTLKRSTTSNMELLKVSTETLTRLHNNNLKPLNACNFEALHILQDTLKP